MPKKLKGPNKKKASTATLRRIAAAQKAKYKDLVISEFIHSLPLITRKMPLTPKILNSLPLRVAYNNSEYLRNALLLTRHMISETSDHVDLAPIPEKSKNEFLEKLSLFDDALTDILDLQLELNNFLKSLF